MSGERTIEQAARAPLLQEFREARELVTGNGAPAELFIPENFPLFASYSPESLDVFRRLAKANFNSDLDRLEFLDKYPRISSWLDETQRGLLVSAVSSGMSEEDAIAMVRKDFDRMAQTAKNKLTGFGVE